ncbi:MAG: adenylosuccinate lyase family protein [Bacteroidetes bacterium]|jgi:3-carboxy-cis,cis-muconate cycloisomerase|nr:adenylosuccinate lyase family protein [Bacteroidota bacterium]
MSSSIIDSNYYKDMFGTSEMREIFSDDARLQAWIDTEIALAKAQVQLGIIPKGIDKALEKAGKIENLNIEEMKADFDRVGFPILPFVKQLNKVCDSETARWIHYGATTQDILDTGMVLQIKKGIQLVEEELNAIIAATAILAQKHSKTVMAGRTFQQLAAPITFGYKAAVWLDEMLRHRERIQQLKERVLVGQCAGAVGTFATLKDKGIAVQELMMTYLELKTPDITWHTARDSWAEIVNDFAMISATFAKIANEIAILMRSEVGELSEPFEVGRGASTTLPQKRNPISCEPIIAIAPKMRELASSQLTAMIQEHERGVGQMNIEWMVIPEAFILMSGSLKHTRFLLENLWVGEENMRKNLNLGGGLLMSESVMMGLAPKVGKAKAHHLVYDAAGKAYESGITLKEALMSEPEITNELDEEEIDTLTDPINYIGCVEEMIQKVLQRV